mmetsp:Transcript_58475/g.140985  ORF Transcript_58475/g.140985 Transcript_58475/m.140985 type:complete len:208 (+) Transcript_58475:628-1251(+)
MPPLRSRKVAHDRVNRLALVELLFQLLHILRGHAALGEINVPLVLVHAEDQRHLLPPHIDELLDRTDAAPRKLREKDHTLCLVILQQGHIDTHDVNALHEDKHNVFHVGVFVAVHARPQVWLVALRHGRDGETDVHRQIANELSIRPLLAERRKPRGGGHVVPARCDVAVLVRHRRQHRPPGALILRLELEVLLGVRRLLRILVERI